MEVWTFVDYTVAANTTQQMAFHYLHGNYYTGVFNVGQSNSPCVG